MIPIPFRSRHISQQRLKLAERGNDCRLIVQANESFFRGWTCVVGMEHVRMGLDKDRSRSRDSGA